MNNTIRNIVLPLALAAGLAPAAWAHNYLSTPPAEAVTTIPDIGVSRAAYRSLAAPGQLDVYEFTARKGQELYVQMTVPLLDRQRDFAPAFVLLYAGSDPAAFAGQQLEKGALAEPPHDIVDRLLPHQGAGEPEAAALAVAYDGSAPLPFDEPFTGTKYWIRQTLTVAAPADGTYRLGVYSPGGASGKYVLAPGKREQFGFGDLLSFPSVRITVRQFCEQPIWPDVLVLSAVGAALLGGIGLGIFALARR